MSVEFIESTKKEIERLADERSKITDKIETLIRVVSDMSGVPEMSETPLDDQLLIIIAGVKGENGQVESLDNRFVRNPSKEAAVAAYTEEHPERMILGVTSYTEVKAMMDLFEQYKHS